MRKLVCSSNAGPRYRFSRRKVNNRQEFFKFGRDPENILLWLPIFGESAEEIPHTRTLVLRRCASIVDKKQMIKVYSDGDFQQIWQIFTSIHCLWFLNFDVLIQIIRSLNNSHGIPHTSLYLQFTCWYCPAISHINQSLIQNPNCGGYLVVCGTMDRMPASISSCTNVFLFTACTKEQKQHAARTQWPIRANYKFRLFTLGIVRDSGFFSIA